MSSAWGPETHASVAPFRSIFQTAAVALLTVGPDGIGPPRSEPVADGDAESATSGSERPVFASGEQARLGRM